VPDRNSNPSDDPIVALLRRGTSPDTEDAVRLVGFVGEGRQGFRIHPDRELQRWLEVPAIIHSQPLDPEDASSRSEVWVDRQTMIESIFSNEQADQLDAALEPAPLSTWNLIPETRLAAAAMLRLLPSDDEEGRWYS
jgi:hypothetical protein